VQPLVSTSLLAAILFWATLGVCAFSGRTSRRTSGETRRDRGTAMLIVGSIVVAIGFGIAAAGSIDALEIPIAPWPLFLAGLLIEWAGISLTWWAQRALGRFYRPVVTIHEDHRVVTSGPYRYVRHPIYAGAMVVMVGVGLALGNWLSLALCVLLPLAAYVVRIRVEEGALEDALGDSYREYEQGKARLVPWIW
jgi:protein-S-isoprenylcysteine O-methyltransferase Ste14